MTKKAKLQVDKPHYFNLKYDSKERWASYWYQINEVVKLKPKTVLEIGVGNKTVSGYFKKIGIKVTTVDFGKNLKPDIVASVLNLPFKKNSFDVVLCAEVLEHLPFKDFPKALKEIYKVTKNAAIITLPHFSITNLYFGFKLIPFIAKKEFTYKIDFPIKHQFLGEHYWEIGKRNYPLNEIIDNIKRTGFKIGKTYYPKENYYHHFFVLLKE